MGGRGSYLDQRPKYETFCSAYRAYLGKMLTLSGIADASAKADRVVALETVMAKVQWSPFQPGDLKAMLKPMNAAGRKALALEFDSPPLLSTVRYGNFPIVCLSNLTALINLRKLLAAAPVATWQDRMKLRLASASRSLLAKAFDWATFNGR